MKKCKYLGAALLLTFIFWGCLGENPVSSNVTIDTVTIVTIDTAYIEVDTSFVLEHDSINVRVDTVMVLDTVVITTLDTQYVFIDDIPDTSITGPVSFSQHIQPIFNVSCVSCHHRLVGPLGYNASGGMTVDSVSLGMELDSVYSYTSLQLPAFIGPGVEPGMRVVPGDTALSLLWWKISKTSDELAAAGKGLSMPYGLYPTPQEVELIGRWIMEGAENN